MGKKTRGLDVIPEAGPFLERTEAGDALFVFLRAHRIIFDAVDRDFRAELGLSFALWEVLVILSRAPDMRLRMVDVTRRMLVSKSNVTQLIDKLERAGMATREPSASDRRLIYATPTPEGIEAVRRGGDIFNEAAREHFAQYMTANELRTVGSGLSKVIAANVSDSLE
jgi:DNA-binding MarR family transcriptional regulator